MSNKNNNRFDLREHLRSHGGPWIGAARSWMQHNLINGSSVRWGSHQDTVTLTVAQLEEVALEAATAAILEDRKYRV